MEPAIVTSPPPARLGGAGGPAARERRRRFSAPPLHVLALIGVLAVGLGLRLWGIKQGLPYSYNSDEASHFVPTAVGFVGGDLNPHYFLNPPAYTYLLYVVLVTWFGGGHGLHHAFLTDPASVYVVARAVAAVLGLVAAWLTYVAGRRAFGRWAGVAAAAVLSLAFLPVFYSHLALNDAPALAPVALALVGVAGIVQGVRRGLFGSECPTGGHGEPKTADYVLAGLGVGLGAATKYTAGFTLLCLLCAFGFDAARDRAAIRRLAVALAAALVAFVAADPYAVLDHGAFFSGLSYQANAVGVSKLGTNPVNGWVYYLWTFTWGFGWAPAVAGLGGGALLLARWRWLEAAVLCPAIVAFLLYMGDQQRFFGRWLMPTFPLVALLAGFAVVEAVRLVTRSRPRAAIVVGTATALGLLAQAVAADVHDDLVLSRPDTRNLARSWMLAHVPPGSKVVIEPIVPANWNARWQEYPTPTHLDQYESHLYPGLLSTYTAHGYCWVLTGSQQSGRAFVNPRAAPGAVAYYAALAGRGRLVYRISPYWPGSGGTKFNFDFSFDYYPGQYRLPGPAISIYRLGGGRCGGA
jgi:hypothetical protein